MQVGQFATLKGNISENSLTTSPRDSWSVSKSQFVSPETILTLPLTSFRQVLANVTLELQILFEIYLWSLRLIAGPFLQLVVFELPR